MVADVSGGPVPQQDQQVEDADCYGHGPQWASSDRKSVMPTPAAEWRHLIRRFGVHRVQAMQMRRERANVGSKWQDMAGEYGASVRREQLKRTLVKPIRAILPAKNSPQSCQDRGPNMPQCAESNHCNRCNRRCICMACTRCTPNRRTATLGSSRWHPPLSPAHPCMH